jgi:uncharacterized SAM-dependent methyltransferase
MQRRILKYYKNAELVKLYNVSEKSVRNWITATQQGKASLDLYTLEGRVFIADTIHNSSELTNLVEKGRKYRNQRSHRRIAPKKEFYQAYTHSQILDISHDLDVHRELAVKYRYFRGGGLYWDRYLDKLFKAGPGNLLTNTVEALELSYPSLDALSSKYKHVNLINICIGNSMAARGILGHFLESKKLKRVVTIDISQTMLDISEKRIKEWFGEELEVEKYLRDLGHQRFQDILGKDTFGEDASNTINLVLFLAGPLVNFREPGAALQTIHDSMGRDDLLLVSLKRDTPESRRFFDFNVDANEGLLNFHDRYLLQLLNIDESYFEVEQFFDEEKRVRIQQIRLKLDLTLSIDSEMFKKEVRLSKGEAIQIWRSWHHSEQTIIERLNHAKFTLESLTKSKDNQLMLLTTKIEAES